MINEAEAGDNLRTIAVLAASTIAEATGELLRLSIRRSARLKGGILSTRNSCSFNLLFGEKDELLLLYLLGALTFWFPELYKSLRGLLEREIELLN
jgi:hypothetical protein